MSESIDLNAAPMSLFLRRWWRPLSALGITLITLVVAHVFFTQQYRTNDDVGMTIIAAGVWRNPTPSPYLLYVHIFLGYVISGLYTMSPDLPMYRLVMVAIHAMASSVIYFSMLPSSRLDRTFRSRAILIFVFASCIDLPLYVQPQFTLISLHCGVAALSLWVTYAARNAAMSWRAGLVFVVIVVLCGLVRAHAGIVNIACFAPAVMAIIWFQSKSWAGFFKNLLKQAAPAAALVTIILGLTYVHETIYAHSKGWETFSEYNMLRAEYIDYHTIQYNEANKPVFDDAGWNETDFELFRGWFQLDDERYSLEKLRWISERASKIRQSRKYPSIASVIDAVFVQQKEVYYLTLILFIPFLFFDYRRFLWLVYPAFALCIIAICSAIIFALDRFPIHVYCGFFEYLFVVGCLLTTGGFLRYRGSLFHFSDRKLSLLYAMKRNQSGPLSFLKSAIQRLPERFQGWGRQIRLSWMSAMMFEFPVIQTLLVLFVVYVSTATAVRYQFNFSERVARYQTNTRNGLAGFQPTSDVLYVVFAMSYPLQHHNPYDNFKSIRNSRVIQLGTATRSPFTYNRMKEFGITDVYQAILEREDVKVIAHPNAVALFLVSAEQRLGKAYDAEVTEAYIIPHRRDNYTVRMEALNFTPKPSEDSGVSNP